MRAWLGLLVSVLVTLSDYRLVNGAAIIEDHTTSWRAAGLGDSLAEAFEVDLPDELFDKVLQDCLVFHKHETNERARASAGGGAYVHGKGGTYWRPLFNAQGEFLRPRFHIEAAIQLLYEMDIGKKTPHPRVSGGELWVQKRDLNEDIGFHHDKDEAMASLKSTMKFPEVSTVTYMTDKGAPTVIFNQTTPDGNGAIPTPWFYFVSRKKPPPPLPGKSATRGACVFSTGVTRGHHYEAAWQWPRAYYLFSQLVEKQAHGTQLQQNHNEVGQASRHIRPRRCGQTAGPFARSPANNKKRYNIVCLHGRTDTV